jgi:hypothetical protein
MSVLKEETEWKKILFSPEQCQYYYQGLCVLKLTEDNVSNLTHYVCRRVCARFSRKGEVSEQST